MKITILDIEPDEDEELILKCHEVTEEMMAMIRKFKQGSVKLIGYGKDGMYFLNQSEIYYFESVDQKVFAYEKTLVYEVKEKLYELENMLSPVTFMRATKSTIINLEKIESLSPAFGGRFEAVMMNGEKQIISRQYVAALKERLGL